MNGTCIGVDKTRTIGLAVGVSGVQVILQIGR